MAVVVGMGMRKRERKAAAKGTTSPRLIAMMSRKESGGHNLKPTIYLPSGVTPKT